MRWKDVAMSDATIGESWARGNAINSKTLNDSLDSELTGLVVICG